MPETERENVIFVGLNELDRYDQKRIKEIIYTHTEKLEHEFKNITSLKFHFKRYDVLGRVKYSVHMYIDGPSKPIAIDTKTADWDAVKVVNIVMDKAREVLKKRFKGDTTHPKGVTKEKRAEVTE